MCLLCPKAISLLLHFNVISDAILCFVWQNIVLRLFIFYISYSCIYAYGSMVTQAKVKDHVRIRKVHSDVQVAFLHITAVQYRGRERERVRENKKDRDRQKKKGKETEKDQEWQRERERESKNTETYKQRCREIETRRKSERERERQGERQKDLDKLRKKEWERERWQNETDVVNIERVHQLVPLGEPLVIPRKALKPGFPFIKGNT